MASPASLDYLSRKQMEYLIEALQKELQGSVLLLQAVVAKVGSVEITDDEIRAAADHHINTQPIENGFRLSREWPVYPAAQENSKEQD